MKILMLAEQRDAKLSPETARVVNAAQRLGDDIDVLVAGDQCGEAVMQAAAIEGVRRVLAADSPLLAGNRAEVMQTLIMPLMREYDAFLAPATACGRNIAPRIAAMLDVMQISDIIAIEEDYLRRPVYAGDVIQIIRIPDPAIVATIRPSAFAAAASGRKSSAPIENVAVETDYDRCEYVGEQMTSSLRPDPASARCVVSGGRALGSEQGFVEYIHPLADALGAAVGASRAAVDAGYAPNDCQIGQTGRMIAPELYIAAGISGAVQHIAGIKEAGTVVAVNADENAPIFAFADYGLIGDLFSILPELTAAVSQRRKA